MRLESLRSLKEELKEGPAIPTALRAVVRRLTATARSAGDLSERLDRAHTRSAEQTTLAMGVAPGKKRGDFRLGVRIQARGPRAAAMKDSIERRAKGEVDVRVMRHVRKRALPTPRWFRAWRRPLEPGLSVGQAPGMAGTLGAIVEDDDAYYILSNNHVLADVNRAEPGDPIAQPGDLDRRTTASLLVGVLDRFIPISFSRSNVVDCAIAEIFEDLEFWVGRYRGLSKGLKAPRPITVDDLGLHVLKAGRTTGITRGTVTQVEVDRLSVDLSDEEDGSKEALFSDQIEVEGTGRAFSDAGDSGALIVDLRGHPRALLFCGGPDDSGRDLTYANLLHSVLAKLGVRMVV